METRQITQGHIYYLVMNGVYDRCEDRNVAAVSEDLNVLLSFYNENLLPYEERYRDDNHMYRSFKKGLLHNYNPVPFELTGVQNYDGLGIKDAWVDRDALYDIRSRYQWIGEQTYL